MNILQFYGAVEIGLIYALVAIGVYITFKIVDFPDLTVDGTFTLGAAVSSAMIVSGYNPFLASFAAIIAGSLAGSVTGYLNVRWNILGLLASILTMTALYSINLRIMGRPNIAIIDNSTIFGNGSVIIILLITTFITCLLLHKFFKSNYGLGIRAIGINEVISSAMGINVGLTKIFALALSNAVVALAGALFAQSQGFADIAMGTGTIITGLASVIIGEALIHPKKIVVGLVTCALGSIIYRLAISLALNAQSIGLEASDLNLITALIVAFTLIITKFKNKK